jgi:hypothetical protein
MIDSIKNFEFMKISLALIMGERGREIIGSKTKIQTYKQVFFLKKEEEK